MVNTTQSIAHSKDMLASLRDYWTQAGGYQKFLYVAGFLLLASAVFHTGVLVVTGGSLEGDTSWRKPTLFGESFGLTCISVAWFLTFLPKRRIRGWLLAGTLGLANLGEVFLVGMQQWRGVPSHFNNSTPFDSAVFLAMGFLILVTGVVILAVTLSVFLALGAAPSLAWAIRAGMVLLVAGQFFGVPMITRGGHTFGAAGAMKVPHALALHGAQVLPLLAWLLLFAKWSESRRTRTMIAGTLGYSGLVAVSALQAYSGLRMPDKDGLAVLEEVNFDSLPTRVIVLTAAEDDRDVIRAMRLGARGVVLKQSATDLLVKSIYRVHAGEIWLDNHMTAEVMKAFAKSSGSGPRREMRLLSDREKEIVQLVAQGYRNKEMGEKLFISEQTVKNHLHNIFDKLGVSDRLELALYAIHHRLVEQG